MISINTIFAAGTIVLQLVVVLLFVNLFLGETKLTNFVKKYFLQIGFFATLVTVLVSLTYSAILGYPPCVLCWWARVFMFPQLVLFGVGWIKKKNVSLESLALSVLGIIFSGYHVYIELGGGDFVGCGTGEVSCLQRYVFEFGYITIPVMALSGFVFLTLLSIYKLRK